MKEGLPRTVETSVKGELAVKSGGLEVHSLWPLKVCSLEFQLLAREKIHSSHTEQKIKNNFKNSGVGISEVCYDLELDLQLLQQIVEDVYIYKCMFTHKDTIYT